MNPSPRQEATPRAAQPAPGSQYLWAVESQQSHCLPLPGQARTSLLHPARGWGSSTREPRPKEWKGFEEGPELADPATHGLRRK